MDSSPGEGPLPTLQISTFFLCPHVLRRESVSPLIRTLILLEQGSIHMISFNLNYFFKSSISKYSHMVRSWLGLQYMNLGRYY